MLTHIPYRQWCQHCVSGKAKGNPHCGAKGYLREMPTVVMDYMYMKERQREEEEGGMPILVTCDLVTARGGTGNIMARVVPAKGVNEYAVQAAANELTYLGHKELILKSDGEPAIVALKEAIKSERKERIIFETSPVAESKSNGAAENTVQQVQGQVRTIKHALESRLRVRVPEAASVIPWMVMHAARCINRYRVGKDGRTAYRRVKGKEFRKPIAEFGESVMYLKPNSKGVDKLVCRWEKGVWLGVMDESGETIIGTSQGVVRCRDIKRISDVEDRWNAERVLEVQGTPWQTIPGRKGVHIPVKVPMPEESTAIPPPVEEGEPAVRIKRRSKLQRQDVIRAGLTPGCPGCTAISRNAESQNHTEECRKKVEEWLINKGGSKAKLIQEGRKRVRWADQQEHKQTNRQASWTASK